MNILRTTFALSAALAVTVVVACGDKVTVPADKTGKCVAGLLTKCGDTCVDLQTDLANCGACGTACATSKGEICSNGKCGQACPVGSTKCGDKCVDTNVDRANCGKCGQACGATDVCAGGTCAGNCESAGYLTCQGATTMIDAGPDASLPMSCVDPKNDPNNCGGCGIKCGANAPNCAFGSCSKCNPKVLVLSDNQTAVNANMKTALKNAGFDVTMVDDGTKTYAGTPAATDFGAVVLVSGNNYLASSDMPTAGQQAIVAAQAAGTGVIFDCFDAFAVTQKGLWQTIKPLELLQYAGASTQVAGNSVNGNQAWLVPQGYSPQNLTYWMSSTLINGGVSLGTYAPPNYQAAAYRATPGGRIAHVAYAVNYQNAGNQWTNDAAATGFFSSLVRWVATCSN